MTKDIPIARMAEIATCFERIDRFAVVKNVGERTENRTISKSSTRIALARSRVSTSRAPLLARRLDDDRDTETEFMR
jgi:hypothetical protein